MASCSLLVLLSLSLNLLHDLLLLEEVGSHLGEHSSIETSGVWLSLLVRLSKLIWLTELIWLSEMGLLLLKVDWDISTLDRGTID